jgi:transposase InsO family protein
VIDVLSDLFILRGVPGHIRSDNGPEFVAKAVQDWITAVGAKTAYIAPGSPWENGYIESFNARLRVELLDGEISVGADHGEREDASIFLSTPQAKVRRKASARFVAVPTRWTDAQASRTCFDGRRGRAAARIHPGQRAQVANLDV